MNFRLGSIPVRIRPEFFILPLLGLSGLGLERGSIWVLIVFISVLWHELGHATAMRLFGFPARIELHGLGGWTLWPQGVRPSPKQSLVVTLCGPGAQLFTALLIWLALRPFQLTPLLDWTADSFIWVNTAWALVNLLPVLPWDGGMALDAAGSWFSGKPRPKWVGGVSMVVGALAVLLGLSVFKGNFLLAYFGGMGIWKGWQRWAGKEPWALQDDLLQAKELADKGKTVEAETLLRNALGRATERSTRLPLLDMLAWVKLWAKDPLGAEKVLEEAGEDAVYASPELLARLAAFRQEPHKVVQLLTPLARSLELRPEGWPLLMSALDDEGQRENLARAAIQVMGQYPDGVQRVAKASEKLFVSQHFAPAFILCEGAFAATSHAAFAFNAACCLSRMGKIDEGLSWLKRAIDAGYRSANPLESDPDLMRLKEHPSFSELSLAARKNVAA